MRPMLPLAAVVALWLAAPAAQAVVIQATYTGTTSSSTVLAGDPCATGLSGAGGCSNQSVVIDFRIDTSLLAPDRNAAANVACYCFFVTDPHTSIFMTATARLNGQTFQSIPSPSAVVQPFEFRQLVQLWNQFDFGPVITDQVALQLDGASASDGVNVDRRFNVNFSARTSLLTGVDIGQLQSTGLFSSAVPFQNGSLDFMGPTGHVTAQIRFSSVVFSVLQVPEPEALAWTPVAALALLVARQRRRG